tara:strand:- start:731 stop:2629 length:1899 start_codon:yes stop_codon:yes gene_type:complete
VSEIEKIIEKKQASGNPATPAFTYADLIVDYLSQIDVEYVFGIPGGAIEGLFDALARRHKGEIPQAAVHHSRALERKTPRSLSGPKMVVARHETGAAFMADGYARSTGRLGVCCSTTGPGATNLLTGVANAYVDRVPMLVITPQTALPSFGQRGFQESSSDLVDIVSIFDHCTRYSSLVSHPDQLEGKLFTALSTAFRRPRGPVHLSIPADILSMPVPNAAASFNVATLLREPIAVDDSSYQALLNAVEKTRHNARKITLFIGEDCGDAADQILHFADLIEANIVTSPAGKRWLGSGHPRYCGVFGFAGHESARRALIDDGVDLVLAVGTSFNELDTAGWDTQALLNDRLVHIASSVASFDRSPMAYLHVYGNLHTLFAKLIAGLDPKYLAYPHASLDVLQPSRSSQQFMAQLIPAEIEIFEPEKLLSQDLPIKPQRLMAALTEKCAPNSRYFVDTGNAWSWATHYMHLPNANSFYIAMGFGAMGWAIGAVIGAAFGNRHAPVVCITGDGSYLMSGQEITVAIEHQLPVIYVILNDQAYGMVKHGQRMNKAEEIGAELPPVNFAEMAQAMGVKAHRIECWEDFSDIDPADFKSPSGPMLLDFIIDGEEMPPMKTRLEVLQEAKHGVEFAKLP